METSLMILEVDGSIANPAVAWAVVTWGVLLLIIAFIAARRFRKDPRTRLTPALLLLAVATPVAVKLIANLIYAVPLESFVAVHFWGMSPLQWLAPALALVFFAILAWWPRRHVAAV